MRYKPLTMRLTEEEVRVLDNLLTDNSHCLFNYFRQDTKVDRRTCRLQDKVKTLMLRVERREMVRSRRAR